MKGPTPNLTHAETAAIKRIVRETFAMVMQCRADEMIREDEERLLYGDGSQHSLTGIIHTKKAKK